MHHSVVTHCWACKEKKGEKRRGENITRNAREIKFCKHSDRDTREQENIKYDLF